MPDPDAVLSRLTGRLAPLERDLYQAWWTAATDASPETSAARQRAEEALLAALGDPQLFADVQGALAGDGAAAGLTGPSREVLRIGQLVFARWCLVVVRFEQAMYSDPGGDLAGAWWDLVGALQGLRRPPGRTAPDWASKIHLAVAPVYYQSYLLGELLASQLDQAVREHAGGFVGRPEAGAFLAERVFAPGATQPWRDLVASATGSPLGPAPFVAGLAT